MSDHDQGPAYADCFECDGVGYFERVVGERQPGLGGIKPIIREVSCEDCNGDGFVEREKDEMAEEIEQLLERINGMQDDLKDSGNDWVKASRERDALLGQMDAIKRRAQMHTGPLAYHIADLAVKAIEDCS